MKLFFVKWKKVICLSIITVLILTGINNDFGATTPQFCYAASSGETDHAAQTSEEYDEIRIISCSLTITCSTESMMLKGSIDATMKPTGAEIYRAKIKSNGKNGNFKKIGSCKDFIKEENVSHPKWIFNYEDNTVKTGNPYAYKYKIYYKTEGTYQYTESYSKIQKGMAAKAVGTYTCKIVKNTTKKLIVKLTGKNKKNGLLESQYPPQNGYYPRYDAELRYKNDGENEIHRDLKLIKYSYNGKKWYTKGRFAIKGKQCVYLCFEGMYQDWETVHNIKFSKYQYAQMFFFTVKYNLQGELYDRYHSPQIRFNLSSGTAAVRNFVAREEHGDPGFVWDGEIFTTDYELIGC